MISKTKTCDNVVKRMANELFYQARLDLVTGQSQIEVTDAATKIHALALINELRNVLLEIEGFEHVKL